MRFWPPKIVRLAENCEWILSQERRQPAGKEHVSSAAGLGKDNRCRHLSLLAGESTILSRKPRSLWAQRESRSPRR